jgi:hypothetical protein
VAYDAFYLLAWFTLIQPVLSTDLAIYNSAHDGWVRGLQIAGLPAIAAAALGSWAAWRMVRGSDASRLSRVWSVLVALALLGVLWICAVGQLMSWSLNY